MESLYSIIKETLNFPDDFYTRLIDLSDHKILSKKEFLLQTDKVCSFIGFVENGILRSYKEKDGEEYIGDFYTPGSFVTSYRSFILQQPSIGSIQALESSKVLIITKKSYDLLLSESPLWYKLGKYIVDTLFIKKCSKETSLLMDSAKERYNLLLKTYPQIEQHVSQYHIASYLGIKPESLSRIKSLNIGQ